MSVTFLGTQTGSSPSWTVSAGMDKLVVANVGVFTSAPSALDWEGDALTKRAHPDDATFLDCSIWEVDNPDDGTFTLGGTGLDGSHGWCAWEVDGVDGSENYVTAVYNGADPDDNTLDYTSPPATGDFALGVFADLGFTTGPHTPIADTNEDADAELFTNNWIIAGNADGDGATISIGWAGSGEEYGEGAGLSLTAVAAAVAPRVAMAPMVPGGW